MNKNLQKLILAAILITIGIVLSNILSISYPPGSTIIRIGFGYLPLMIISIILGPRIGFVSAIIQDFLGWIFFGYNFGPFFLGFTLNAILYGVVPGLLFSLRNGWKNVFLYLNIALLTIILGFGVWGLIEIDYILDIIQTRLGEADFNGIVIYIILIIGIIGALLGYVFLFQKRKVEELEHRVIFFVIVLQIVVTLILTPIWITILYEIPILPQLPLRIVKTPLEVFVYSILLIRLLKVFSHYKLLENNSENI